MDNNFDSGVYGNQPQRPFTEKPGEQPQPFAYSFNPEKPLMQNNSQAEEPQTFDPVQHTATYQNGEFSNAPVINNSEKNFVYSNQGNDYSQPSYYNPSYTMNTRQPYQGYNQPIPPQPPQFRPAQPPAFAPVQGQYPPAAPNSFANEPSGYASQSGSAKPKANKGLIAVIIVLAALLAASLIGILVYVISESADNGKNYTLLNQGVEIPDYTFPNEEITTSPRVSHDESDYSDKIDKNYKGLALAEKPGDADKNSEYTAEYAYNKISDSVVGVMCYSSAAGNDDVLASQGSGIIFSQDGCVITNAHVVGNSKTAYAIKVITADGDEYTAGVVGFDARTDLAVLKMDGAKGLSAAQFGNSDNLTLGEDIIIVGNPGGINYQNSMTKGIVSALDRDASNKSIVKYIQTDAAINPGNSGGPAVNMYGQVIGIASAKIANEMYEGMGFCIPSATAKTIVDSLMKNGYVEGRVKIGISGMAITAAEAEAYSMPQGIMIDEIDPDGPCAGTGLEAEDIITQLDGTAITSFADIYNVLEQHKEGDKVKLKYYRYSEGSSNEIEITLQADK